PKSMQAELVALRVLHDYPVLAPLIDRPDLCGSFRRQPIRLLIDAPLPLLKRSPGASTNVEVEVDAVLHHLALGDALEVQARALAFRVHDRAGRIPLVLWNLPVLQEGFPGGIAFRRVLQLVRERRRPEVRPPL